MSRLLLAFAFVLLGPGAAHAQCVSSSQGTHSFATRLSPGAGIRCLVIADVYEGPSCDPGRHAWSVELGCNESRRMAISERGRLVSILAPRATRPDWEIVRVHWHDGASVQYGSASELCVSGRGAARHPGGR